MPRAACLLLFLGCSPAADPVTEDADTDADTDADSDSDTDTDMDFVLSSPDFESSEGHARESECDWVLPAAFQCENSNPELAWDGVPDGTAAFVLLFDDPDASNYPHWAIYNIPPTETGLAAAISGRDVTNEPPGDARELENGFGWDGYLGSCPGSPHLYRWRLWAVDSLIDETFTGGAQMQFRQLRDAARERALALATLCHLYGPAE